MRCVTGWVLIGVVVATSAVADTLILNNGKKIENVTVVQSTPQYVIFTRAGSTKQQAFRARDVKQIIRAKAPTEPAGGDSGSTGTGDSGPATGPSKQVKLGKNTPVPIPFVLTATYAGNAPRSFLDAFAKRVADGSAFLWKTTHGQMYVSQITVRDKARGGDLRIQNLNSMKIGKPYARAFPGSHIDVGGKLLAYTLTHELMHLKFNIPDEYRPRCEPCIMSANPRSIYLCIEREHKGSGRSCWQRLKRIVPRLRIPTQPGAPRARLPKVPKTRLIVQDR